jgi:hypothetical protein
MHSVCCKACATCPPDAATVRVDTLHVHKAELGRQRGRVQAHAATVPKDWCESQKLERGLQAY